MNANPRYSRGSAERSSTQYVPVPRTQRIKKYPVWTLDADGKPRLDEMSITTVTWKLDPTCPRAIRKGIKRQQRKGLTR
jgi:hypothetical protein